MVNILEEAGKKALGQYGNHAVSLVENEQTTLSVWCSFGELVLRVAHFSQVCGACGTSCQVLRRGSKRMRLKISKLLLHVSCLRALHLIFNLIF